MMKASGIVSFAAGTLLLVPTAQDGSVATLEDALGRTVQAIEFFAGFEQQAQNQDPDAVDTLLRNTESALFNEPSGEARIFDLRDEINRLQIAYDAVLGGDARPDLQAAVLAPLSQTTGTNPVPASDEKHTRSAHIANGEQAPTHPFTGLNASTRSALAAVHPGSAVIQPAKPAGGSKGTGAQAKPVSAPDPDGYSADPVRQARACYKAGLYERGLLVLAGEVLTPEGQYWKARLLEMLERTDEALEVYKRVIASDDPELSKRAQGDLDFLEWRVALQRKPKAGASE